MSNSFFLCISIKWQGRGQNILFGGAITPSYGEHFRRPHIAESNFENKQAILRSGFDYLTFWCIQILVHSVYISSITAYLLYTHTANAITYIGRKKTNLLDHFGGLDHSCLGLSVAFGGLAPKPPLVLPPLTFPAVFIITQFTKISLITLLYKVLYYVFCSVVLIYESSNLTW